MKKIAIMILIVLLIACAPVERLSECKNVAKPDDLNKVWCVIDGDTFKLASGRSVRLIGINAPESKELGSLSASRALEDLVLGENIVLEKDVSDVDYFGRLLRYVYVNNVSVNADMVRKGWAKAAFYAPDLRDYKEISQAQMDAIASKIGIWGTLDKEDKIS